MTMIAARQKEKKKSQTKTLCSEGIFLHDFLNPPPSPSDTSPTRVFSSE